MGKGCTEQVPQMAEGPHEPAAGDHAAHAWEETPGAGTKPQELGQALAHREAGLSMSLQGLQGSLRRTLPKEWAPRPNRGCQTFSVKARG